MTDSNDRNDSAEAQRTQRNAEEDLSRENKITEVVIGSAIEVHRQLGPGLLESVYEECLAHELRHRGLRCEQQKTFPLNYKGLELATTFRVDLLVGDLVVVELKSVDAILPVHESQLVTYLRLSNRRVGLLINFNVEVLRGGIRRKVLTLRPSASSAPLR